MNENLVIYLGATFIIVQAISIFILLLINEDLNNKNQLLKEEKQEIERKYIKMLESPQAKDVFKKYTKNEIRKAFGLPPINS